MEGNNIYVAAAGSGKTSFIIKKLIERYRYGIGEKKLIAITYTARNQENVKNKISKYFGGIIPGNIEILGWYSFLLDYWIRPFKGTVLDILYEKNISIIKVDGQSGIQKMPNGKVICTYHSDEEKFLNKEHDCIFSDKLAEFAYKCYEKNKLTLQQRLSNIIDSIFIDEIQDLSGWDFEIIKVIVQSSYPVNCILCGDPRQQTYKSSSSSKNKVYGGRIDLYAEQKINKIRKKYVSIDNHTLNFSHRCITDICDFASKIAIGYEKTQSCNCQSCCQKRTNYKHRKGMFLLKRKDIMDYIEEYHPISLIWDKRTKVIPTEEVYNFGECKGLEADASIIYPTTTIVKSFLKEKFELKNETQSKFYVAVTRARYSAAIVVDNNFDNSKIGLSFWSKS